MNENKKSGYISVFRSVLNNPFWLSEKFTRGQAWIDLLLLAKYKEGFFYKRGVKISYKRGDVTEGVINLSKRWCWSRNKTQKFINDLEKEQQIKQQKSNVITLLSIVNYEIYQEVSVKKDNRRTTEGQQKDTHNKDNNINKLYSDQNFLQDWAKCRKHYLKKPTHIKKLDFNELNNFKNILVSYTSEEIKKALHGLFKQQNKNISSMYLKPKHFLENFDKYYNAELSKDYSLYGTQKQKSEL